MGCSSFKRILKWRRKPQTPQELSQPPYGTRPAHTAHDSIASGHSGFTDDIEKVYIRDGDEKETGDQRGSRRGPISALPPSAANYRPNVHPQFSAYAGVASRADRRDHSPYGYSARQRGRDATDSRDNWTGSQVSTQVSSRQSDQYLSKIKDEGGVEDPEQEARRKKAEEIRRKFEEEEQERLDFLQMM